MARPTRPSTCAPLPLLLFVLPPCLSLCKAVRLTICTLISSISDGSSARAVLKGRRRKLQSFPDHRRSNLLFEHSPHQAEVPDGRPPPSVLLLGLRRTALLLREGVFSPKERKRHLESSHRSRSGTYSLLPFVSPRRRPLSLRPNTSSFDPSWPTQAFLPLSLSSPQPTS